MRTFKSLLAAVLMVVMMLCMSLSSFAAYDQFTYDDLNEMFNTTLSMQMNHYVKFVDALGIITAYKNGDFNPSANVTRGEALKIAYRMLHYNYDEIAEYQSVNTGFDENAGGDINDVHMLKPYIAWAQDYQLINSEYVPELKFDPDKPITGKEFMTLMTKVAAIYVDLTNEDEETVEMAIEDFQSIVLEALDPDEDFSTESETINREAAAVVVARTMMYDPVVADVSDDMFVTFTDWDGNRLNCLATEIYGCNSTDLTVRATKQRPLDYEGIIKDALFSNGAQVDVGFDMSPYIGYEMKVVYLDKDGSGTFTEDEEFITYEVGSPWVHRVNLSQLNIAGYGAVAGANAENPYTLYSNSLLYLNDNAWPNTKAYNLTDLVKFVSFQAPAPISNRPNLEFTFIQHSSAENVDTVFATEWIPGKIMTVTDNYISVYSYYDDKVHVYDDNKVEMTAIANPSSGEFVDFYEANDRLYMKAGNTITTAEYRGVSNGTGINLIANNSVYVPHLFFSKGSKPVTAMKGEITAVLDSTGTTYLAAEEVHATKDIAVEVLSATANADGVTGDIEVRELMTDATYIMTVELARISSSTGVIDAGNYFTYYTTANGDVVMNGIDKVTVNVVEYDDYFAVDKDTVYLKTDGYTNDKTFSGKTVLYVDAYQGVWAAEEA